MNTKFDKAVILIALLLLCLLFITIAPKQPNISRKHSHTRTWYIIVEVEKEIPEPKYDEEERNRMINYYQNWYLPNHHSTETITEMNIEYDYLGYYYCTAYSPQETGSWGTASGTTLHRADYEYRLTEPTTCAIDRNLHRFGDLFYIPAFDRVFVAEDTGSAVRGNHLDLGYTDLESVWSFPTGSYEVYSVDYIYSDFEIDCYDIPKTQGMVSLAYRAAKFDI